MTSRNPKHFLILFLLVGITVIPGCGPGNQGNSGPDGAATKTPPPATDPGGQKGEKEAQPGATANPVKVILTEFHIQMPETLSPGRTEFQVANEGTLVHNFEIVGQGIDKVFKEHLPPGRSDTMIVELKPGTYRVYCPVGAHAARGMSLELKVQK